MALRSSFQEDQLLFGGPRGHDEPTSVAKVVVTATSSNGNAVVFGNYNRRCNEKRECQSSRRASLAIANIMISSVVPYQFWRPDRSSMELKVWEV